MMLATLLMMAVLGQAADVPPRVIDQGAQSGIDAPRQIVVRSAEEFARLWAEHSTRPAPPVDFAKESVVAIFLGSRPTAGYGVEIASVSAGPSGSVVKYREVAPAPGRLTAQVLTSPFVIAGVPRLQAPVHFESAR